MTTYYGVWSGKEWWYVGENLFHPTRIGLAKARAMVANTLWKSHGWDGHWEARAIGEDGLPVSKSYLLPPTSEPPRAAAEFEAHPEHHPCAMCGEPAKEYVDVHIKGRMCERHKFVKLGCFSKGWPNDYVIDGSRKYVFCDQKGCWLGFPMEEEL